MLEMWTWPSNKTLTENPADNRDGEQSAAGIQVTLMGGHTDCVQ